MENHPDLPSNDDGIRGIDVFMIQKNLTGDPGIRNELVHPVDAANERGLPAAGWPHNGCNSILGYRKVDLFQDLVFPKKSAEILDL